MKELWRALLLALFASGASAADQPTAERPDLREGDVFDYVGRYETIACQRWEVKPRTEDGALRSQCGDNVAYFAGDNGALLRIVGKDGGELVKFQPETPAIPFPLHVGSRWSGAYRVITADDPVSPDIVEHCEVIAFETVRVAAGDLPSFRFDCVSQWSVWPLHGSVTVTSWYAPAAKAVVKSVNSAEPKWNLELAGYRFK